MGTNDSPTTQWAYDGFGELANITDPDGNVTQCTYDSLIPAQSWPARFGYTTAIARARNYH